MIKQKKDAWALMARTVSMLYIFAFLFWSVKSPLQLHRPAMVVLQLVFIGGLFFWRKRGTVSSGFQTKCLSVCLISGLCKRRQRSVLD